MTWTGKGMKRRSKIDDGIYHGKPDAAAEQWHDRSVNNWKKSSTF